MKKISYILCLTLVFSILTITPVSYAVNLNEEVAQCISAEFFKAMNIADPVKDKPSGHKVTRAEALTAFVALFGYHTSGEAEVPFTDVKGKLTGVLHYALNLKMISESDTFRPDDAITYDEAFKMCTVALGYDYLAKLYGGWPAGYLKMARECELSDGLDTSEITISKMSFYLFIENLLTAEMLEVEGVVGNDISYRKHTTVLKTYFDLEEIEGIVTANAYTGLYSLNEAAGDDSVLIDNVRYSYKGSSNYIGQNVKAYVNIDKSEIKVMIAANNKIISVAFADVISTNNGQIHYYNGDKETQIRIESAPVFVYNGKSLNTGKVSDYLGKQGNFTFVDNDGDNVFEVCEANEYRTVVVSGVNAVGGYINDINGEKRVDISDEECKYFVYENGEEKTISDIGTNALLSVYESKDKLLCNIVIENQSVTGIITGFTQGSDEILIDDIPYSYGLYFKKYFLSKVKHGQELTMYLSSDKSIQLCTNLVKDEIFFGYFLDVAQGVGLDASIKVKFVAHDGTITICDVDKKLAYNGVDYSTQTAVRGVFFDALGNEKLSEQLIRYKLNTDGNLILIDTIASEKGYINNNDDNQKDNLKEFAYPTSDKSLVPDTIWMSATSGVVLPWYAVTNDTFIIQVNPDTSVNEANRFAVRDLAWLKSNNNWKRTNCKVYNVDEYLSAGALVFNTAASDTVNDESKSGIVYSVTKALDEEGMEAYKIVIFTNDYYTDYFISDEEKAQTLLLDGDGKLKIGSGDLVRFSASSQGQISALALDYDCDKKTLLRNNSNAFYLCYFYGAIHSVNNGKMTMIRSVSDGSNLDMEFHKYVFRVPSKVYIFDSKTGDIRMGSADEITTYLQSGDTCDRVLVKSYDLNVVSCTIYR